MRIFLSWLPIVGIVCLVGGFFSIPSENYIFSSILFTIATGSISIFSFFIFLDLLKAESSLSTESRKVDAQSKKLSPIPFGITCIFTTLIFFIKFFRRVMI